MWGDFMAMMRRGTDDLVKDMEVLQDDFAPHQNEAKSKEAETFQTMDKFQKMARFENKSLGAGSCSRFEAGD